MTVEIIMMATFGCALVALVQWLSLVLLIGKSSCVAGETHQ